MCPHFIPSPHSPTKPSKRRCGVSPRARVLTPDSLFLTDLIIHHDLTPRDLMHFLLVTARVVLLLLDRFRASAVKVEADIPRNLPRNLPPGACLPIPHHCGIVCGLTIPFISASAGWLAGAHRHVPQGEPWGRFLLNRRSMNE